MSGELQLAPPSQVVRYYYYLLPYFIYLVSFQQQQGQVFLMALIYQEPFFHSTYDNTIVFLFYSVDLLINT